MLPALVLLNHRAAAISCRRRARQWVPSSTFPNRLRMGLSSVQQTALSGISAAASMIAIEGNNLANSQTAGFKALRAAFAAQAPRTSAQGDGGSSQIGVGVQVASTSANFGQGTVAGGASPLSLAIEGDGLFILEGRDGKQRYTRDGQFRLNANRQLVGAGGQRVLGYAADAKFKINTTRLSPLQIPLSRRAIGANGLTARLIGFSIGRDGRIGGRFSDGVSRNLGQIAVARFANPAGLVGDGGNGLIAGPNTGLPAAGVPGSAGNGSTIAGAAELSTTDVSRSLVNLSLASNQFRAGIAVLETTTPLFDELLGLRRPL